jgi:uncharacterized HAD superfamily protein
MYPYGYWMLGAQVQPVSDIKKLKEFVDTMQKKKLIGVDLDGVLFDFIGAMHRMLPSVPEEPESFDVAKTLNKEDQEAFEAYLNNERFWLEKVKLYPGALDFIQWLKRNNYQPIIITSRNASVADVTKSIVWSFLGIPPEDVIFEKNKLSALLGLGIDTHIEDSPAFIEELSQFIKVLVPKRPWNTEWVAKHGNNRVLMYNSFEDLYDIMLERNGARA